MTDKLGLFDRTDVVYKTLNGISFKVAVLVPKLSIASRTHARPLLVHFHGGGLIMGTILDPVMLPRWLMQFGASQDAVIVSPEYRLLPEASGSDLFDDVGQFWTWIHTSFPAVLSGIWPGLFVDFDRIAAAGESAGGYLALQSATLFPAAGIKLVMAQYCALDIDNTAYNPVPSTLPTKNDLQMYLSSMKSDSIRLSSPFPEKLGLLQAVIGAGRHRELIGLDDRMNIRNSIRLADELPAIWIAQGMDDTLVGNPPLLFYRCRILDAGTRKMYDANVSDQVPKPVADDLISYIRETHAETALVYSVQPGGHGFDVECTLEESWVVEGIGFAKRYW